MPWESGRLELAIGGSRMEGMEGSQLAQAPHSCVSSALDHMARHCFVDKNLTFVQFKGGLPALPFTAFFFHIMLLATDQARKVTGFR